MMRALILLHRWLGVAFCLLFAMWFASGIVMHFVPFPALTEAERFAGLAPIDLASAMRGPAAAVAASEIGDVTRVRLVQRSDGPVYLVYGPSALKALRGADFSDGAVRTGELALAIARDYAQRRHLNDLNADVAARASYDQWTVSGRFDPHRPLYRIALHDDLGTELYVSSATGEIVLATARRDRAWNYAGSIAHWIYPTALRSHPAVWSFVVWWLSLAALIGAGAGALIGTLRIGAEGSHLLSPYRGWQAWHHRLGLICMVFVLTWIFSGWLSMDSGQLFSTGKPTGSEAAIVTGTAEWNALSPDQLTQLGGLTREAEWFAFDGKIYRRERTGFSSQRLALAVSRRDGAEPKRPYLTIAELAAFAPHLATACSAPAIIDRNDDYAVASSMPDAPVFRLVCGDVWFHIDGANGALLERLDPSRRAYRWFYNALHTLNFPALTARPMLRTALIVTLCACGLAFSLTGVVIALRRLLSCFRRPA
jgi:PepSY-associated TM region